MAKGFPYRNKYKVSIAFDPDMLEEIKALSYFGDVSFAERVRCLTEIGLEEIRKDNSFASTNS